MNRPGGVNAGCTTTTETPASPGFPSDPAPVRDRGRSPHHCGSAHGLRQWIERFRPSVAKEAGLDVLFYDPKDEQNSFELSSEQFDRLDRADLVIRQDVDAEAAKVLDARPT
ncbi:hypothetical protein [Streptomyces sp. NBC_00690]|uniref:hypothetical protein n=1 Tax=Streptomyces sp. NBC_00690 TaxID=2975808 RepID=UPI002E2D15F2|nr:hypothetical protein [Streptomyces sp. NBC_00690]